MAGFGAKVKLTVDKNCKASFNQEIQNLVDKVEIKQISIANDQQAAIRDNIQKVIDKRKYSIGKVTVSTIDAKSAINNVKLQLQNMLSALSIQNGVNITGLKDFVDVGDIQTAKQNASQLASQLKVLDDLSKSLKTSLDGATKGAATTTEIDEVRRLTDAYTALIEKIEALRASEQALDDNSYGNIKNDIADLKEETLLLKQVQDERKKVSSTSKSAAKQEKTEQNTVNEEFKERMSLLKQINTLLKQTQKIEGWSTSKNGKTKDLYDEAMTLQNMARAYEKQLGNKDYNSAEIEAFLKKSSVDVARLAREITGAGENTKTFADRVGGLAQKFSSWLSVSQVLMTLYRALKQVVSTVIEVDTAMTELRKVTDETDATYSRFLDNASERAKKIGATLTDVVNSSADFARLGYELDDAASLADTALVYKNVGDGIEDINTASESIISTMQAFKVEAQDSMLIVDKFNAVGNNFAISSGGIGEALLRSASAMKAANNTLDETIALVTAANTVVQNPEKVGTTMKTLSMFLRAAKTEAEEAGESTEGMANSVSELRSEILALTGNKVDIQIDEDTFKSTYQIMKELSQVWGELTDVTRANILEMVGGKRNSNVVAALLENFALAERVMTTSANSAGSALEENEKYLDSIKGTIAEFQATFQEFSTTLVDSGFITEIIDIGTGLMEVLNGVAGLIDSVGGLNSVLITTVGLISAKKISSLLSPVTQVADAVDDIVYSVTMLDTSAGGATKTVAMTADALQDYMNSMEYIPGTISEVTVAGKQYTSITKTMSAAQKEAATSALAMQAAMVGITLIISAVSAAVREYKQRLEEQRQAAEEAVGQYNEQVEAIAEYKKQISELKTALDEENLSEQEAYEKRQELLKIQDDIVEKLGKEAAAFDILKDSIDDVNASLDNYSSENLEKIYREKYIDYDKAEKEIEAVRGWGGHSTYRTLFNTGYSNEWLDEGRTRREIENIFYDVFGDNVKFERNGSLIYYTLNVDASDAKEGLDEVTLRISKLEKELSDKGIDINEVLGLKQGGKTWMDAINAASNEAQEILDTYSKTYSFKVKYDIEANDKYSSLYDEMLQAADEMNEAFTDGNAEAVKIAYENWLEFSEKIAAIDDKSVRKYLEDMYNDVEEASRNKYLKVKFDFIWDMENSSIRSAVDGLLDRFATSSGNVYLSDIYEAQQAVKSDPNAHGETIDAYKALNSVAEEYGYTLDELLSKLLTEGKVLDDMTLNIQDHSAAYSELKVVMDDLGATSDSIAEAFAEQSESGTISVETYKKLVALGDEYTDCLESNGRGLVLSREKIEDLTEAKNNEAKASLLEAKAAAEVDWVANAEKIIAMQNSYELLTDEQKVELKSLEMEAEALANICNQYSLLIGQLESATSGYQKWMDAQNAQDSGFVYDEMQNAKKALEEGFKSGKTNTAAFQSAMEFLIPEDYRDSLDEMKNYYINTIKAILNVDNGFAAVDRFMQMMDDAGLSSTSKDGQWTINPGVDLDAITKELNMTKDMVLGVIGEINEYDGADIRLFDGSITSAINILEPIIEKQSELNAITDKTSDEYAKVSDELAVLRDVAKGIPEEILTKIGVEFNEDGQMLFNSDIYKNAVYDTAAKSMGVEDAITTLKAFADTYAQIQKLREGGITGDEQAKLQGLIESYSIYKAILDLLPEEVKTEIEANYNINGKSVDFDDYTSVVSNAVNNGEDITIQANTEDYESDIDAAKNRYYETWDEIYNKPFSVRADVSSSKKTIENHIKWIKNQLGQAFEIELRDTSKSAPIGSGYAEGTAHASGSWGAPRTETALTGELGREILVRNGRWYTIGDNGAEFVDIKKGDIIFNHLQTKALLKNGRVSGRGKSYLSGTAYNQNTDTDASASTPVVLTSGSVNRSSLKSILKVSVELDDKALEKKLKKTLDKLEEELSDILGNFEHSIFLMEKNDVDGARIVDIYRKMQIQVHELADKYRAMGLSDNSDYIQNLQKKWWEYEDAIEEVKQKVVDDLLEMTNATSEAVDEIQNVFDTFKEAANEYAENGGFISVDTFQKLMELGPEYMQYLRDENGLLVINEETIKRVLAAKTEQLALDNALAYVERLRLALNGESLEDLNQLLYATTETTNSTWGLVYANLALLNLTGDQYQAALYNINAIRSMAENAIRGINQLSTNTSETLKQQLEDIKQGLDDILEYVMDMLEHRIEQQIEALEDAKDAYAELIELRKESLETAEEEASYQDEIAEKVKEMAKLQERINALSLDDSRDAQAQKVQLEEELAEIQKELGDTQREHAIEAQKESLDKMQEAYEEQKDKEIEKLEESISSYQKLYDMAIKYIDENLNSVLDNLLAWNSEYGNSLNSEITEAWNNALAAVQRYGSYVGALSGVQTELDNIGSSNNIVIGNTNYDNSSTNDEQISAIVTQMKRNADAWHTASTPEAKQALKDDSANLGAQLNALGVPAVRKADGVWYVGSEKLFDKYAGYIQTYHTGGIAGDNPTLKQDEVMAVLKKGEPVLDKQREEGLYKIIDFTSALSEKLGTVIKEGGISKILGSMFDNLDNIQNKSLNYVTEGASAHVEFGDVYIYGANDETVEKHREVTRQFTNDVLKHLKIKR